jgi:hypothetical protein
MMIAPDMGEIGRVTESLSTTRKAYITLNQTESHGHDTKDTVDNIIVESL